MRNSTKILILLGLSLAFCGLYLFQGLNGSYDYALPRRAIKVMAMAMTGVAIAYSTVIFQTITHNRILTPSIMGFDSLYILLQTVVRSEEHTSELQSRFDLVCRLLLEKKKLDYTQK